MFVRGGEVGPLIAEVGSVMKMCKENDLTTDFIVVFD